MKFIQLSTIAALAIFATAPGVSAAGLRAGVDKGEDNSGRRKLYRKYGRHHRGPQGGLVGPIGGPMVGAIHTPDTMEGTGWYGAGPAAAAGGYGSAIDYDNSSENNFYNRKFNHGYGVGGYGEYNRGHRGGHWDRSGHSVNGYKMYMEGLLP